MEFFGTSGLLMQKKLLKLSYEVALESPDPSTQNGALLVNEIGDIILCDCNRFPDGVKYKPERWERPLKYKIIEHAERNVIFKAAKLGISTENLLMICGWAACTDCARSIIQSGIKTLITHKQAHDRSPPFWADEIKIAHEMLNEAGIRIIEYDGDLDFGKKVRHSGEEWMP